MSFFADFNTLRTSIAWVWFTHYMPAGFQSVNHLGDRGRGDAQMSRNHSGSNGFTGVLCRNKLANRPHVSFVQLHVFLGAEHNSTFNGSKSASFSHNLVNLLKIFSGS